MFMEGKPRRSGSYGTMTFQVPVKSRTLTWKDGCPPVEWFCFFIPQRSFNLVNSQNSIFPFIQSLPFYPKVCLNPFIIHPFANTSTTGVTIAIRAYINHITSVFISEGKVSIGQ